MARRLWALAIQFRDVQPDDDGPWRAGAGFDEGIDVLSHVTSMTRQLYRPAANGETSQRSPRLAPNASL